MGAWRVGLTGGIGSGKTTVLQMFGRLGASTIDADTISRSVTASGGAAIAAIAAQFGTHFIDAAGALDRELMRELAYRDPQARNRLEAIIHPLVATESARQVQAAIDSGARCMVFDIPLLVESGRWRRQVDEVLVVDCSVQVQSSRVVARSALTQQQVEAIIAAQAPRVQRLAAADVVICNERLSLEELHAEVLRTAQRFGL